ncbi:MAG: C40 family peptidase [Paludibacteraceae bacterium]|jgi:gamma-D-glutamyl-L-lysine dipeptidyl-peptidase|nr:C40 family peptidase [Paludibacteraceae bacterium]
MKKIFLLSCAITLTICVKGQQAELPYSLSIIKETYAPDLRIAIFETSIDTISNTTSIHGKTNLPKAYKAIQSLCETNGFLNNVILLPANDLSDSIYGIINISTAFIRATPHYESELLTQALLGTPVRIWEKHGSWFHIQTPDGYLGWLTATSLQQNTRQQQNEWLNSEKLIFTDLYGQAFSEANKKSVPVSDIVAGCTLNKFRKKGSFYEVTYPDGRTAFLHSAQCQLVTNWIKNVSAQGSDIVNTSKRFLGLPYLWGGTSTKAVDCSGFVKTVYSFHNIILPRDASQQVKEGIAVNISPNYADLQLGDLLFFGSSQQRITHVGIYIGNQQFIHSSGTVHINSLDPKSHLYIARYASRLQKVRRIIGHTDTQGISSFTTNSFYNPQ